MTKLLAVLALVVAVGCGDRPRSSVEFVNRTPQSDAFLSQQWRTAQAQVVAGGEDLTAIRTLFDHTPPQILAGDPRGASVAPGGLLVESMPGANGSFLVQCPQPCDVNYAVSYSLWGVSVIYADGWNGDAKDLGRFLQYEFTSQILWQLGYDVRWR